MTHEEPAFVRRDDFREHPPESDLPVGIDIIRAPAKGSFVGICLSEMALGKYTHFHNGRTQPCGGEGCPICLAGGARRWHSWVFAFAESTRRTYIVEVTAAGAHDLANFRRSAGTLRGFPIKLERIGGKVNSRVRVSLSARRVDLALLPESPSLFEVLDRIWSRSQDGIAVPSAVALSIHGADELETQSG